jgi:hypothetical protein
MLFKEITAVYSEKPHKTHKYKIERYRLLRYLGRFKGLIYKLS